MYVCMWRGEGRVGGREERGRGEERGERGGRKEIVTVMGIHVTMSCSSPFFLPPPSPSLLPPFLPHHHTFTHRDSQGSTEGCWPHCWELHHFTLSVSLVTALANSCSREHPLKCSRELVDNLKYFGNVDCGDLVAFDCQLKIAGLQFPSYTVSVF